MNMKKYHNDGLILNSFSLNPMEGPKLWICTPVIFHPEINFHFKFILKVLALIIADLSMTLIP